MLNDKIKPLRLASLAGIAGVVLGTAAMADEPAR